MCPKLFILKEFYFLILESNVETHHKYFSKGGSLGPVLSMHWTRWDGDMCPLYIIISEVERNSNQTFKLEF